MTETPSLISTIYAGWHTYQGLMLAALQPLSAEQLALSAAPGLRSIGQMATHVIGARARWFHSLLGEGGQAFQEMGGWDRPGVRSRTAAELVQGLQATWQGMQAAIAGWTPTDWQQTWPGEDDSEPATLTRQWVIWHLIEHDLHHGGEISMVLGMHGLKAPDV